MLHCLRCLFGLAAFLSAFYNVLAQNRFYAGVCNIWFFETNYHFIMSNTNCRGNICTWTLSTNYQSTYTCDNVAHAPTQYSAASGQYVCACGGPLSFTTYKGIECGSSCYQPVYPASQMLCNLAMVSEHRTGMASYPSSGGVCLSAAAFTNNTGTMIVYDSIAIQYICNNQPFSLDGIPAICSCTAPLAYTDYPALAGIGSIAPDPCQLASSTTYPTASAEGTYVISVDNIVPSQLASRDKKADTVIGVLTSQFNTPNTLLGASAVWGDVLQNTGCTVPITSLKLRVPWKSSSGFGFNIRFFNTDPSVSANEALIRDIGKTATNNLFTRGVAVASASGITPLVAGATMFQTLFRPEEVEALVTAAYSATSCAGTLAETTVLLDPSDLINYVQQAQYATFSQSIGYYFPRAAAGCQAARYTIYYSIKYESPSTSQNALNQLFSNASFLSETNTINGEFTPLGMQKRDEQQPDIEETLSFTASAAAATTVTETFVSVPTASAGTNALPSVCSSNNGAAGLRISALDSKRALSLVWASFVLINRLW